MERAFLNRTEGGRLLAEKLEKYANRNDVVVLGLPRGGVPVAYEVAKRLNAPLDVFIVRKLGVPGFEGLATGATMRAAVKALRQQGAAKIVVAVPVGPPDTCQELAQEADEAICLSTPQFFQAVGQYYEDFSQTSDDDVRELLTRATQERQG